MRPVQNFWKITSVCVINKEKNSAIDANIKDEPASVIKSNNSDLGITSASSVIGLDAVPSNARITENKDSARAITIDIKDSSPSVIFEKTVTHGNATETVSSDTILAINNVQDATRHNSASNLNNVGHAIQKKHDCEAISSNESVIFDNNHSIATDAIQNKHDCEPISSKRSVIFENNYSSATNTIQNE